MAANEAGEKNKTTTKSRVKSGGVRRIAETRKRLVSYKIQVCRAFFTRLAFGVKPKYAAAMNNQSNSNASVFAIGADKVDAEAIVEKIRATVADKTARGAYRDPAIARAERTNLAFFGNDETFFPFYLECLKEAAVIDINDYEITEKRTFMPVIFIWFKKALWKLLRFYTYRLWSQQNQTNALLVAAIENMENRYRARLREIEEKIAKIERNSGGGRD